jgi:hypothetical protein
MAISRGPALKEAMDRDILFSNLSANSSSYNGLLPESLFACSETFLDKSRACSRRFQNSPSRLNQLESLVFRFAKIYEQKTPQ